ncbi:hypothetical protein [uncultured Maribacter sp.]|uniref:hypothetical protein n=1 Tax=uncultured Maribacter sp. TaxID=431308 RepID=UPI0026303B0B|nr:hypothetical protein [uncultured Maribacter sp.]
MASTKKILKIPIRITIAALLAGMLSRVLNWPYAFEIILISFCSLSILYAIRFYKKEEKKTVDYVKMTLVLFWTTNGILNLIDFPYTLFFQIVTGITFITWFVMEGTAYFMDEDRRAKNSLTQIFWNIAMLIGTLAIIFGSLLKILDWQYAIPLLTVGILIIASYILKDLFIMQSPEEKDQNNGELQL